ncbi:MAG: tRNA pseudouridine(55) synthase TruB [Firmicutes bacterium]|nr:tRNA pseudouridine(55) synthase TruB [Bacillota bacterium]
MDGFLNILKPTGMTSHDVVKVLRRILGEKKTGHTGTLDPMAVGVLPIGIGAATKITEYLDNDFKKYRCELLLGMTTDTGDIWGEVIEQKDDVSYNVNDVYAFEKEYRGEIMQTPPMYSAVRIGGKRLYEYARNGEEVEVKARKITIKELKIIRIEGKKILFDVECSKGTYVRTICTEMGEKLGCGAAMSFLARTASGRFSIENTVTFEEIEAHLEKGLPKEELFRPVDYPIDSYRKVVLDAKQTKWFVNGGHLKLSEIKIDFSRDADFYRVYNGDEFIAMAYINTKTKKLVPHKVFFRDF